MERDGEYMKTCKDCIHYPICSDIGAARYDNFDDKFQNTTCIMFKDKSKFIELPCSIGSYCIYKNDIWYIDKILYLGINVFFTSLINMASHLFTRAPVGEIQFISEDIEEARKKLEELNSGILT